MAKRLRNENAERMESAAPADPMDAKEPMLPIERTDPLLPIERIDPREPIDRIESVDRRESIELLAMSTSVVVGASLPLCVAEPVLANPDPKEYVVGKPFPRMSGESYLPAFTRSKTRGDPSCPNRLPPGLIPRCASSAH
jgi:hypothetical protein